MSRNKKAYGVSLDLDIIDKLDAITEYGKASGIVNQILRDHLDEYLNGKPSKVPTEDIRQMIREELSRLQVQSVKIVEDEKRPAEMSPEIENKVMSVLDDFLRMRK